MSRLALILTLAIGVCPAQEYHVSPDGSDDGDGRSAATAWRTLLRASREEYQPGDRILLRSGAEHAGTLRLRVAGGGDPARPVEVTSTGERPATIVAGDGDGVCLIHSGVTVRNLIVKGSGREGNKGVGVRASNNRPGGDKRSGIRIRGVEVSGFTKAGILIEGRAADGSDSGFQDVLIEACKVTDGVHHGIHSFGPEQPKGSWKYPHAGITVRGCEVSGITGDPDKHDNHSGNGIFLGSVDGALIERCCAHDNGARNGSKTGGPVGIWTYCSRKVVIQHCESYANRSGARPLDGGGFDLDGGVVESVLQYNYSHDNDGAGYLVYSYEKAPHEFRDNIVRFNVSVNDGRRGEYGGIVVGHHGDRNVNTTVHNNLVIVGPAAEGKSFALVSAQTEGMKVFNNVFVVRKGAFLVGTWGLKPGKGLQLSGNTWLVEGKPQLLQGNAGCGDFEEWVKKGDLDVASVKDTTAALSEKVPEAAAVYWPREPASAGALFKAAGNSAIEPSLPAFPAADFLGRPIRSSRFAGPYAP